MLAPSPPLVRRAGLHARPRQGVRGVRAARARGFTLLDLLVTISIIALLIAILAPALSGSREVARRSACLINLKTWGLATHLYRLDFQDLLPLAPERASNQVLDTRFGRLQDVFSRYIDLPANPALASGRYHTTQPWHCPSDNAPEPLAMSSYGYRPGWFMFNLRPYNPIANQVIISRLARSAPGSKPIFEDFDPYHLRSVANPGAALASNAWRNAVFDDGRAAWVPGEPVWTSPGRLPDEYPTGIEP